MIRKLFAMVFFLAVLLCFGCEKKNENPTVPADDLSDRTTEKNEDVLVKDGFPAEPPQMEIVFGQTRLRAMRGSYSWRVDGNDEKSQYTIADGIHPLSAKEYMPCLSMTPTSANSFYTAQLLFEASPNKIVAEAWPIEAFENQNIWAESVSVDTIEIDYADGRNSVEYILHLKNDDYIYHITAEWERKGEFGGSAEYCFYTEYVIPEIVTMEAEDGTGVILCGYPLKEDFE